MAHEFGHLLFDYLFTELNDHTKYDQLNAGARYLMRGVDEGFADFTAYTLTGNSNTLAGSFETLGPTLAAAQMRQRDFTQVSFNFGALGVDRNGGTPSFQYDPSQCVHTYYCTGILINHAIYRSQIELGYDPYLESDRIKNYQQVVSALKIIGNEIRRNGLRNDLAGLTDFFDSLLNNIGDPQFSNSLRKNLRSNFSKKFVR
jgi:hypothetical protein